MPNRVLAFHYVLTNPMGEVIDSSREGDPFSVLEGRHQIIPGLESELFQMAVGEKRQIFVTADKAYGSVQEDLKIKLNRDQLPEGQIEIGTRFNSGENGAGPVFIVTDIVGQEVFLNGNHPLAGVDLNFDVEVISIREATAEELAHGHAHGAGGHHH